MKKLNDSPAHKVLHDLVNGMDNRRAILTALRLIALEWQGKDEPVLTDSNLKPRSNHKRHLYMKKCKLCGKACKGAVGMATHITRYHNGNKWSRKGRAQVSATPMGSVSPNS